MRQSGKGAYPTKNRICPKTDAVKLQKWQIPVCRRNTGSIKAAQ